MKYIPKFNEFINEAVIIVSANSIIKKIDKLKNKITNKGLGNLEIESILNNALANEFIQFEIAPYGTTYPDDEYAEVALKGGECNDDGVIYIHYDDECFWQTFDNDYVQYSIDQTWDNFLDMVKKIIEHELIHREQIAKMGLDALSKINTGHPGDMVKYLSNKMEIMAWAHNAISEFVLKGYPADQIAKRLKNPLDRNIEPSKEESQSFYQYTEWFEPKDPVFKLFLKYCYGYLQEIIERDKD